MVITSKDLDKIIRLARKKAEWEIGSYSGKPIGKLTKKEILKKLNPKP